MKYTIHVSDRARADVHATTDYLRLQASPDVAMRWYTAFEDAVVALETMPASNPLAPEQELLGTLPGFEVRQRLCMSHRLLFMILGREVHVLRVIHTARQVLRPDDL